MIEYRIATEADLAILANMRWDYWQEEGQHPAVLDREAFVQECAAFLRQDLSEQRWICWLAVLDGEIVSHISVQRIPKVPKPSKPHDAFGYVTNVYTRPAYRGQGIGAELLAQVQAWALEQDLEFLVTWPSEASTRFYERAGFAAGEAVEYPVRPYVN